MDLNTRLVMALDARFPGGSWETIAGQLSPGQREADRSFPSALDAHRALLGAGYQVTSKFVPLPPVMHLYDVRTVLRYANGDDVMLVVMRRRDGSEHDGHAE